MSTKNLEQRVAALEKEIAEMKERRARIVPKEIEDDPNIQQLMQDRMKNAVNQWKTVLHSDGVTMREARLREIQATKARELEAEGKTQRQREQAELLAVIQYYEKYGTLPENCGYEIEDDGFEPVNSKLF